MRISDRGIDLIKTFEGCRLKAYRDSVGVPTIGYGHTAGVKMGATITQAQADQYLREDLAAVERTLNKTGVNFRQEQFDALCSWVFNLGAGNYLSSTMRKKIVLDAPDEEITDQLVKWHHAGGKPLTGLKRRRVAEANMFLGIDRYYMDASNNIIKK